MIVVNSGLEIGSNNSLWRRKWAKGAGGKEPDVEINGK